MAALAVSWFGDDPAESHRLLTPRPEASYPRHPELLAVLPKLCLCGFKVLPFHVLHSKDVLLRHTHFDCYVLPSQRTGRDQESSQCLDGKSVEAIAVSRSLNLCL
jgi:hypothetical protein